MALAVFAIDQLGRRAAAKRNQSKPVHAVPDLFSATLAGNEPELHGRLSDLRASPEPLLERPDFLCAVPDLQPDAKTRPGDRQLSFSHRRRPPRQRNERLAGLAALRAGK